MVPLAPVERRSVPDEVFSQLLAGIVAGEFASGGALPSERRLADVLQVSRPAVREALQRLAQSGLVDIRQGGATTVNDYRDAAGLDLLPRLLLRDGGIDLELARGVVELRGHAGPHLARLAAQRRRETDVAALSAGLEGLAEAVGQDDDLAMQAAALELWDAIVIASDNLAYRLLWNSLRSTYDEVRGALAVLMHEEVSDLDGHRAIVDAIVAGDPGTAEAAAAAVLSRGTEAALAVLAMLREDAR